jgi:exonuclease III
MGNGGLAVYVSEYHKYSVRHDLSRNEKGIFESMFIGIKTQNKPLIVGNIYWSPSGSVPSFLQILDEILEAIQQHSCELVIMGDFNINLCDRGHLLPWIFSQICSLLAHYLQHVFQLA